MLCFVFDENSAAASIELCQKRVLKLGAFEEIPSIFFHVDGCNGLHSLFSLPSILICAPGIKPLSRWVLFCNPLLSADIQQKGNYFSKFMINFLINTTLEVYLHWKLHGASAVPPCVERINKIEPPS